MNEQHVAWAPWSGPGHEHLVLREAPKGLTAHSFVEGVSDQGRPFSLRYYLRADSACRVREVELALLGSDSRLSLRSDGAGLWSEWPVRGAHTTHCVFNKQYPKCYEGGAPWNTVGSDLPYTDQ